MTTSHERSITQSLFSFLTLLSAVTDERERARLATTAIARLLPCHVSGIALLGENDKTWRLLLQCDGREMASLRTDEILADIEALLEHALGRPTLTNVPDVELAGWAIPPSLERLGVRRLAIAPLATLRSRLGALVVGATRQELWSQEDEMLLLTLAEHTAINTENQRFHKSAVERTEEMEAFSYSVSHDLRGPLRVIDGFSRSLMEDHSDQLDVEGKRLLDVVHTTCMRMQRLIDDLLGYAHLHRREVTFTEIDMAHLARDAFEEVKLVAQRPVELGAGDLPSTRGDRSMVRQVWVNLLSNAIKFTRTRDNPDIRIGSTTNNGVNTYFVTDNGVGFDGRYAESVFGIFERLHTADEFEGTGVGLAIVHRIVQRHSGRVWAEGAVDGGATIYFTLGHDTRTLART